MFEKLREIIAQQFEVEPESITMDTAFIDDLNADSLDLVDLSMGMDDEFGIGEMESEDIEKIKTVGDLYQYIQEHGQNK